MNALSEPRKERFRLSMLIYDSRYQSMTIQIAAMAGFVALTSWLFSNTAANLATLDKALGFRFMPEPAGYDINQMLLEYLSRDTHLRASLLGLLWPLWAA